MTNKDISVPRERERYCDVCHGKRTRYMATNYWHREGRHLCQWCAIDLAFEVLAKDPQ